MKFLRGVGRAVVMFGFLACAVYSVGLWSAADAGATTEPGLCTVAMSTPNSMPAGSYGSPGSSATNTTGSFPNSVSVQCENFPVNQETGFQFNVFTGTDEVLFEVYAEDADYAVKTSISVLDDSYVGGVGFDFTPGCSGTDYTYSWTTGQNPCTGSNAIIGDFFVSPTTAYPDTCQAYGNSTNDTINCALDLNGTEPAGTPCSLEQATGPTSGQLSPTDNLYTFVFESLNTEASEVVVSSNTAPTFATTPANYRASLTTSGTNAPGTLDYVWIGKGAPNSYVDVDLNTDTATLPTQLNAYCEYTDSNGNETWYSWGNLLDVATSTCTVAATCAPPDGNSSSACEDAAIENTGIGINPGSWVPALATMGDGILKCLFEPSSAQVQSFEDVTGLSNTAGECTGAVGAATWVGCIGKGVLATPITDVTALQSAVDSGGSSCSNSPFGSGTGVFTVTNPKTGAVVGSQSFCGVLADATTGGAAATGNTSAAFTFLHGLLIAAFWLAMAFVLMRYLAAAFLGFSGPSSGNNSGGDDS